MPKAHVSAPTINSGHGNCTGVTSEKRNKSQRWKPRGLGGSCADIRGQSYTISGHRDFCQHKYRKAENS